MLSKQCFAAFHTYTQAQPQTEGEEAAPGFHHTGHYDQKMVPGAGARRRATFLSPCRWGNSKTRTEKKKEISVFSLPKRPLQGYISLLSSSMLDPGREMLFSTGLTGAISGPQPQAEKGSPCWEVKMFPE